jgi:hypothetical protein
LSPSIKSKLGIGLGAIALALLLAAAPEMETDIEVNARMQAEAAAMRAAQPEPCWDELPFRKALTQENINRLCIKVQRPRPVALRSATSGTPTTPKETP